VDGRKLDALRAYLNSYSQASLWRGIEGMRHDLLPRLGRALSDWWSFKMGTIEGWFDRTPETPEDRAVREEGERIRKAFPQINFDHPGANKWKSE
jgi:hypothetical protein